MGDGCKERKGRKEPGPIEIVFKPRNRQPHRLDMTSTCVGIGKSVANRCYMGFMSTSFWLLYCLHGLGRSSCSDQISEQAVNIFICLDEIYVSMGSCVRTCIYSSHPSSIDGLD